MITIFKLMINVTLFIFSVIPYFLFFILPFQGNEIKKKAFFQKLCMFFFFFILMSLSFLSFHFILKLQKYILIDSSCEIQLVSQCTRRVSNSDSLPITSLI